MQLKNHSVKLLKTSKNFSSMLSLEVHVLYSINSKVFPTCLIQTYLEVPYFESHLTIETVIETIISEEKKYHWLWQYQNWRVHSQIEEEQ